jgi:hypothetical protein
MQNDQSGDRCVAAQVVHSMLRVVNCLFNRKDLHNGILGMKSPL